MTDQTTVSTPPVDIQDPLPEANWLWRRVFVFIAMAVTFAILIGLAVATNRIVNNVVGRIDTMSAVAVADIAKQALMVIMQMFRLMFWALIVVVTYYMVAPSAEQITKMMQTAGLLKAGVQIASRVVETPDRRESVQTVAQPPQPVAPPAGPEIATEGGLEAPKAPTEGGAGADMPVEGPENPDFRPAGADSGLGGPDVAPTSETAPAGLPDDTGEDFAPRSKT